MSALKGVGMVGLRMSVRSRVVQEGFMNLKKDSSGPTVSPIVYNWCVITELLSVLNVGQPVCKALHFLHEAILFY